MEIKRIWFDKEYIYAMGANGQTYRQSLLWYPALKEATEEQRINYTLGSDGIHWRHLDTDISYESFEYEDAEPTLLQRFFLTHKEINIAEFARRTGFNATLLRNYINGFKRPSKEREREILEAVHSIGKEYTAATF
ncbi:MULTISPECIES: DUF2442 domain-containing protein [unclassified Prevotella]|uniref:DUF2442 domain-containing protein n=1 Tax=unclassified Prevotella TaxID=2638335 RepID=UPI000512EAF1|nr:MULTISPECIES: DUF2442 domain-containing protein [unclassified Prevotella]KGI59994.1 hypothetical protein HMPREF0671_08455 [Prevotella sp. S7 MS 2]